MSSDPDGPIFVFLAGDPHTTEPKSELAFTPNYIENPPFPYINHNSGDQQMKEAQHMTNSYYPYPPKRIGDTLKKNSVSNGFTDEDGKLIDITHSHYLHVHRKLNFLSN